MTIHYFWWGKARQDVTANLDTGIVQEKIYHLLIKLGLIATATTTTFACAVQYLACMYRKVFVTTDAYGEHDSIRAGYASVAHG